MTLPPLLVALGHALRRTGQSLCHPLRLARRMHRRQPQRALSIVLVHGSFGLVLAVMTAWGVSPWAWVLWALLAGQAVLRWVREETGPAGAMAEVVAATAAERLARRSVRRLQESMPQADPQTKSARRRL